MASFSSQSNNYISGNTMESRRMMTSYLNIINSNCPPRVYYDFLERQLQQCFIDAQRAQDETKRIYEMLTYYIKTNTESFYNAEFEEKRSALIEAYEDAKLQQFVMDNRVIGKMKEYQIAIEFSCLNSFANPQNP